MSPSITVKSLLLVALALVGSGCEPAKPAAAPSDDTKALAKLGGESVGEVILSKPVSGVDEKAFNADFDKIMARDATVNEKIKACRETPQWLPAELLLITPLEIANIEQEFGPPGKKLKKHSDGAEKELEFLTYGNIEVGLEGTKILVVKLNK